MALGCSGRDSWFSWMCAAVVYVYLLADHLDGMQARRTNSGSKLGATLDHLCDFFNGCFIILGACSASGASRAMLVVTTLLFVIAFTVSHLEVALRKELWLGDELWLGTHTPLEGLLIIAVYFLACRYIGAAYWLFAIYFIYKFLAVIMSVKHRIGTEIHRNYVIFCTIVAAILLPTWLEAGLLGLLFWLSVVIFAGTYLHELLATGSVIVPRPRWWAPAAIGVASLFGFADHNSVSFWSESSGSWFSYNRQG